MRSVCMPVVTLKSVRSRASCASQYSLFDSIQPLRPIQLQGFARVSLQPGESKTVTVKLFTDQFGFYSHEGQRQWNILPGQYLIKVGSSSADIKLQETITLNGSPVHKPLRDHYFSTIM